MAPGEKNIKQKQTSVNLPVRQTGKNPSPPPLNIQHSTFNITSRKFIVPVLIFISCFILYGNTLLNEYALDDLLCTTQNKFIIQGFSAFKDIFDKGSLYGYESFRTSGMYRPLTLLSFMTEVAIFGFNPHISHFFNVLFFALTAVALYFFLQKILKNYNQAVIIAATLLFVFHPIHTEVVANIKSRDEILGLLFGLISFYFIMLFQEKNKIKYYIFSLASFFASLFCKESCLTFVAIIPLLLYFFTSLEIKKIALKSIPYFGAVGIYLFIRSRVLLHMTFAHQIPVMDNALMAAGNNMDRIATSFVLLGKYIYMTLLPYPLSYDYSYNQIPIVSWLNIKPILSLLVCVVMIGFMVWGIRRKSIYSFLIALFFITLIMSCNLVIQIAATFAERFLFSPSVSFCIALPVIAAKAWKNKTFFNVLLTCILIIYTIIVIPRNAVWKNNYTLFSSGVITAPNSTKTHRYLAFAYRDSAKSSIDSAKKLQFYSLAIQETRTAIKIRESPDLFSDIGIYYFCEGRQDSAIPAYKKALGLNPKYTMAASNLAATYFNKKQYDSAAAYYIISYKADTNNLNVLMKIGESYQREKNYILALHYDSLALIKDPNNKSTLRNLSELHNSIGAQYVNTNELDKALKEFTGALKYDSNSAYAIENMGVIYAKKGNVEKAKVFFKKAIAKDPKNGNFARNLQSLNGK